MIYSGDDTLFLTGKVKKIVENSGWMIGQNIYFMLVGVLVTAIIARYFGPTLYGQLNYVIAIVSLFTAFSTLGMETLTVKAIVDKRFEEGTILFTSLVLRIAGGLILTVLSLITIFILSHGDSFLLMIGLIYSLFLTMRALEVFEYWAQAKMALKIVSIVKIVSFTCISVLKLLVVYFKGSLISYTFLFLIDALLSGSAIAISYYLVREDKSKWKFSLDYAREILSKCWPIAVSGLMVIVYMRIDQVMLGSMLSNKSEVGIYAAAVKIAEMWYFVPLAIIASFKPVIMQYKAATDSCRYISSMQLLYSIIWWVGVLFGIIITISSGLIVKILYGNEFLPAASVLSLSVWAGIFATLGSARSVWLVCENLQSYTMVYSLAGCVVNVILNLLLIPHYGAFGAAFATSIAQAANILVLALFKDTREHTFMLLKSFSPVYLITAMKSRMVSI